MAARLRRGAAQATSATQFGQGDVAVLHGLVANAALNGKLVWVQSFHPKRGEYSVQFGDYTKMVKPENMRVHFSSGTGCHFHQHRF